MLYIVLSYRRTYTVSRRRQLADGQHRVFRRPDSISASDCSRSSSSSVRQQPGSRHEHVGQSASSFYAMAPRHSASTVRQSLARPVPIRYDCTSCGCVAASGTGGGAAEMLSTRDHRSSAVLSMPTAEVRVLYRTHAPVEPRARDYCRIPSTSSSSPCCFRSSA